MTLQTPIDTAHQLNQLAKAASALGFEIVDIAGFLDLVEEHAKQQRDALGSLTTGTQEMDRANKSVAGLVETLSTTSDQALQEVQASVGMVREMSETTQGVAGWVKAVAERSADVSETVRAVKANNTQIAAIAMQVNTLAINAKIEAARAGEAGRGFAVVADAINELSHKTSDAAKQITQNIETLSGWITELQSEARDVAREAETVLSQSGAADKALSGMLDTIQIEHQQTEEIAAGTEQMRRSMTQFTPAVMQIDGAVRETSQGIEQTHARMNQLIDASEKIVQTVGGLGGESADAPFVAKVRETARAISQALDAAIVTGQITAADLFDQRYTPVPGSDPQQFTTRATEFLDRLLPKFQEPVLSFDPKVVFCAAVDSKGFLPTHNKIFSHPQGADPVWNTANCRNRRLFDDRVGLKAGRNTAPFLLQVYRRDMGGGDFRVMKDLSAPIRVDGRHWGGLRLAYSYGSN